MSTPTPVSDDPVNYELLPSTAGSVLAYRMLTRVHRSYSRTILGLLALAVFVGICVLIARWNVPGDRLSVVLIFGVIIIVLLMCGHYNTEVIGDPYPQLAEVFPSWTAMIRALRASPHRAVTRSGEIRERDHDFLGVVDGTQKPFLLHKEYYELHAMITGSTRSGKTHSVCAPLLYQHLMRHLSHIVVLDMKSDRAFFQGLGLAAREAQLNFKWLTITPGQSSYVWNPFLDRALDRLTADQWVQILLKALSIYTGDRYGAGYFSQVQYQRMLSTFESHWPVRNFRELFEVLRIPPRPAEVDLSRRDIENTSHVVASTRRLATPECLNYIPHGPDDPVGRGAIRISQILTSPGVTYFDLPALTDPVVGKCVAKIVLHLITSAASYNRRRAVPCLIFADEFQEILEDDVATLIRQGRDCGIAYWMAFQSLSDLQTTERDFLPTVQTNTALKVVCSCDEPLTQRNLTETSGEVIRLLTSRSTTTGSSGADGGSSTSETTTVREEVTNRLNADLLNRVSNTPCMAVVKASPGIGLTQFRYPVITRMAYHISPQEFQRRRNAPWPNQNQWTVLASNWDRAATDAAPVPGDAVNPPEQEEPQAPEIQEVPCPAPQGDAPEPERRRRGRPPGRRNQRPVAAAEGQEDALPQEAATEVIAEFQRLAAED